MSQKAVPVAAFLLSNVRRPHPTTFGPAGLWDRSMSYTPRCTPGRASPFILALQRGADRTCFFFWRGRGELFSLKLPDMLRPLRSACPWRPTLSPRTSPPTWRRRRTAAPPIQTRFEASNREPAVTFFASHLQGLPM